MRCRPPFPQHKRCSGSYRRMSGSPGESTLKTARSAQGVANRHTRKIFMRHGSLPRSQAVLSFCRVARQSTCRKGRWRSCCRRSAVCASSEKHRGDECVEIEVKSVSHCKSANCRVSASGGEASHQAGLSSSSSAHTNGDYLKVREEEDLLKVVVVRRWKVD